MFKKQDKEEDALVKVKERAADAADTISKDVGEVLEKEKASLKSEDVEKLGEILEETEDLRQESKE
jgi:mevalonate kinase